MVLVWVFVNYGILVDFVIYDLFIFDEFSEYLDVEIFEVFMSDLWVIISGIVKVVIIYDFFVMV